MSKTTGDRKVTYEEMEARTMQGFWLGVGAGFVLTVTTETIYLLFF